jgi:RNA polymerase sigma-70 factor (ECF subfamily)
MDGPLTSSHPQGSMPTTLVQEDLDRIFREHHSLVYRTAYRITGNSQDAEDVLQTLFLRLLRRDALPDLQANPKGYLHRASVNISLDIIRLRKTNVPVEDAPIQGNFTVQSNALQELLRIALSRLSPKLAEIFALKYVEGYDNAEIAQLLGTSTGTIAVLLFRARTQLKKSLIGDLS